MQQGGGPPGASVHNAPDYATVRSRLSRRGCTRQAGVTPADVDVVQIYENFTGGVVMGLIEHGFCSYEEANEFITFENLIAPDGGLPLNTSGGNLAECYMHGLGLVDRGRPPGPRRLVQPGAERQGQHRLPSGPMVESGLRR